MPQELSKALGAAKAERGQALAAVQDNQWFDRKSARIKAKDLADDMIGFANAEGGTIVIGLHRGRVEGIDAHPPRHNDWRQAGVDFCVPPIRARVRTVEVVNEEGHDDHLLIVDVDPSDKVHANHRDEVLLRIGDETRRLSFEQRKELEFDKGQSNFEITTSRLLGWEDLDGALLEEVAARTGASTPTQLLRARGLQTSEGVTVGAALLFASHPQTELPEAYVRIIRHRGRQRATGRRQQVVEDIRVEGPLPRQIEQAHSAIQELVPTRRALTRQGTFTDVGAIPVDAWLEALVNAVTHRSYSMIGDHIRVEIFDDRMEISSPGRFPGLVDLTDREEITRFARNPRTARVLADLGFGQELGEGVRRMFEEMRLAGLAEPRYEQTSGSVRLTLSTDPVDREVEARLPASDRAVLQAVRERERASTGDIMAATGRSRPPILRSLQRLQSAGVVEWVGNSPQDPRAYWRLRVE